jgi:hypothetical protein
LLSAARRVGFELARVRSKEDQPTPTVLRAAVRDVIRHCIYGVDLNPLAVELCKVALWLEAHDPGQPLNFLDHRIKCGNAIVGLANANELERGLASEAFKTLPGDEKEVASAFKKRNDQEVKAGAQLSTFEVEQVDHELKDVQSEFNQFAQLPESTPEEIARKEKVYRELINGKKWWRLKQLADLQVAQFFIPKTVANKEKLTTHSQYMTYLKQGTQILDRGAALAISAEKRFFHWFLEFPEVFQKGGFDCILGNPPYLGGSKISLTAGDKFLNYISNCYKPAGKQADLVTYFLKRDAQLVNKIGFFSIITTDKISQGDSRELGLKVLLDNAFQIVFAIRSMIWPGDAAVKVSLFSITKSKRPNSYLGEKIVNTINSHLDAGEITSEPTVLNCNLGTCFKGVVLKGIGFVIEHDQADQFISIEKLNEEVLKPFINGEDLNESASQKPSRSIIHFGKQELHECTTKYPQLVQVIKEKVKPYRDTLRTDPGAMKRWWQLARMADELFKNIRDRNNVMARSLASKHNSITFIPSNQIFDQTLVIFASDSYVLFRCYHQTYTMSGQINMDQI